jgi:hypothetical protein
MNNRYLFIPLLCLPYLSFAEAPTPPVTSAPQPSQQAAVHINCEYHIPKDMKVIDPALIKDWSKNAAVQAFTFEHTKLDTQLTALKLCFTDQGFQGFNTAMQKSGNLNAIKSKQLMVSSQANGDIALNVVKDNQWKATIPMQVTYQNQEQKLNQTLTINMLLTRKPSGDLGIMQIVAIPVKQSNPAQGTEKPKENP